MTALLIGALAAAVVAAAGVGAFGWLRRTFVAVTVVGRSMEPALRDGDRVVVRRCGLQRVARADVVMLLTPDTPAIRDEHRIAPAEFIVKRVVALPGDPLPPGVPGDRLVPDGALVVFGDNPEGIDSRLFGPLGGERLVGTVVKKRRS